MVEGTEKCHPPFLVLSIGYIQRIEFSHIFGFFWIFFFLYNKMYSLKVKTR